MITTQQFNDFSSFNYTQKRDFEFMLTQMVEFSKNGGDLTLPVKVGNSMHDGLIISLNKFIQDNIPEPVKFNEALMQAGAIPGICDFSYDPTNQTIIENKEAGMIWIRNHFDEYEKIILQSFDRLLKKLPPAHESLKNFNSYDYEGNIRTLNNESKNNYLNPLFYIAEQLKQPAIYELIFKKYPFIKKEWEKTHVKYGEDTPRFLESMEAVGDSIRKPSIGLVFIKNGIGLNHFLDEKNMGQLHDIINHASYLGDKEFLSDLLPKVNLKEIEKNCHAYELCLSRAKDKETIDLLLNNNATYRQTVLTNNNPYEVDLLFNRDRSNPVLIDCLLTFNPNLLKEIQEQSNDFYGVLETNSFEMTKLLVNKYKFPIENFDMLNVAKKQMVIGEDGKDSYDWVINNGADPRFCHKFCDSVVQNRDDGLKLLRNLNKRGLIVAKSPDMVFNIFQSNPTKIFINYYDKLTSAELEKYNVNGLPAWWGANNQSDLNFMLNRINNPLQRSQKNEPYFFYALRTELEKTKFDAQSMTLAYLNNVNKKNKETDLDLSFTDKNGNNFLHHLFTVKKYGKDSISSTMLENIQNNTTENVFSYLMKPNNKGITPLDLLLTQEMKSEWSRKPILKKALDFDGKYIDLNYKLNNSGITVYEALLDIYKDDKETTVKLNTIHLRNELASNHTPTPKKMKI